jgi:hypothetical protein
MTVPIAESAGAPATRLLIGTYTAGGSEGIYLSDFDTETTCCRPPHER